MLFLVLTSINHPIIGIPSDLTHATNSIGIQHPAKKNTSNVFAPGIGSRKSAAAGVW
jgi:hypothetical protein